MRYLTHFILPGNFIDKTTFTEAERIDSRGQNLLRNYVDSGRETAAPCAAAAAAKAETWLTN